jgi:hypothetical protein
MKPTKVNKADEREIFSCSGGGTRWRTVQNVPLLQEVVSYAIKQYCYKIRKEYILEDNYLHH